MRSTVATSSRVSAFVRVGVRVGEGVGDGLGVAGASEEGRAGSEVVGPSSGVPSTGGAEEQAVSARDSASRTGALLMSRR